MNGPFAALVDQVGIVLALIILALVVGSVIGAYQLLAALANLDRFESRLVFAGILAVAFTFIAYTGA